MEVLHGSQEALLTILEVLLYDPLYNWTISPIKAYQLQQLKTDQEASELNSTSGSRTILDITDSETKGAGMYNVVHIVTGSVISSYSLYIQIY